jgi:hypothetical protein
LGVVRSRGRVCVAGFAAASPDAVARVQSALVTCRSCRAAIAFVLPIHAQTACSGNVAAGSVWRLARRWCQVRSHGVSPARLMIRRNCGFRFAPCRSRPITFTDPTGVSSIPVRRHARSTGPASAVEQAVERVLVGRVELLDHAVGVAEREHEKRRLADDCELGDRGCVGGGRPAVVRGKESRCAHATLASSAGDITHWQVSCQHPEQPGSLH